MADVTDEMPTGTTSTVVSSALKELPDISESLLSTILMPLKVRVTGVVVVMLEGIEKLRVAIVSLPLIFW